MITTFDVLRIVLNSLGEEILTVGDMIVRSFDKDDDEADRRRLDVKGEVAMSRC